MRFLTLIPDFQYKFIMEEYRMAHPVKNILFVSDLSVNMKQVFDHAAALAVCQNAKITILHVMEEDPDAEKRIRTAFGEELYQDAKAQSEGARTVLIGKNIDALKIRQAISGFFLKALKENDSGPADSLIQKILVAEGRSVIDEIMATLEEEHCDMIVMGCRKQGLIDEAMGDKLIRNILKRSEVPVFVVPFSD